MEGFVFGLPEGRAIAHWSDGRRYRDPTSGLKQALAIMANPGEFIRQVRQEASKVTWPTRKETGITTMMVFIMVFLAAVFFFVVDQVLALGVRLVLGLGG